MTSQAYLFLLIGVFVFGAAYQTQTAWLYMIGALTFGLLAISTVMATLNLRHLVATMLPIPPGHQGGPLTARVHLERRRPGTSHQIQVLVPSGRKRRFFRAWRHHLVPPGWQSVTAAAIAPGAPAEVAIRLDTGRRGEFPFPALVLQSAFPVGLIARTRSVTPAGHYLVYPVGPRLEAVPWLDSRGRAGGQDRQAEAGHGMLLRGVREYRPGDAWRQIHWRTTARLGQPHVKETEVELGEVTTLYLDLRSNVHTEATLEHMITIAASLVAYGETTGRPFRLVTQPEAVPPGPFPVGYETLAWLAKAQAVAPAGPLPIQEGAVVLSPDYVPGWQSWAAAFLYAPMSPANGMDATAFCPVGASIPDALSRGGAA